jgi:serine/threonine protein kinase
MGSLELSEELLEEGTFGSVYLGEYKGSAVAIKFISKEKIDYNEIDISVRIYNDYLIRSSGFGPSARTISFPNEKMQSDLSEKSYIVYPLALGDLKSEIDRRDAFLSWDFEQKVSFMRKIAEALDCLHSNGILHMDFKPENVLVQRVSRTVEGQEYDILEPFVSDFGLSRNVTSLNRGFPTKNIVGTPIFNQPHNLTFEYKEYNYSNDVWAYALVFFEFLSGSTLVPYSELVQFTENLPLNSDSISAFRNRYLERIEKIPKLLKDKVPRDRLDEISSFLILLLKSSLLEDFEQETPPYFSEIVQMSLFDRIATPLSECAALIPAGSQYNSEIPVDIAHWLILLLTLACIEFAAQKPLRMLFQCYDLALRYLSVSPFDFRDTNYEKKSLLLHLAQAIFLLTARYIHFRYNNNSSIFDYFVDSSYDPSLLDRYLSRIPRKLNLIFYRRHLYESLKPSDNIEKIILDQVWNLPEYFNREQDWSAILSHENLDSQTNENLRTLLLFWMLKQIEQVPEFSTLYDFLRYRDWESLQD